MAYDLQLSHIGKVYDNGTPAVIDFNLDVDKGEFIAFLGPSGCGKTTTLRMIAGFESITSGDLLIRGKRVNDLQPEKRPTSMIFQNYALFPHMTVAENVAYPLRIRKVGAEERQRRVKHILEVVGLGAQMHKKPAEMSGGQQQRVAIARALVFEPELLLLDEPLSALDKNLREQLQTELQRIHRQVGTSFVFVTHDQNEALALSSRIAIFNHGKLTQVDTPENIYNRPESRFVAEFLGKMNLFPLHDTTRNGPTASGRCGDSVLHAQAPSPLSKQPIVLAVRPEHMDLHSERPNREGYNVIPAQLTDKVYQGSSTHLALKVGGDSLPVNLSVPGNHPGAQMPSGAPVWLSWPVQQSFLLQA